MGIGRIIYLRFRWWLGRHEWSLQCIRMRKDLAHLIVSKQTDVVIEGYPRSGNSFAETAFLFPEKNQSIRMASHLHLPAHVSRGVRLRKPCLILIRKPTEAIASLILYYNRQYPLRQAIREYIDFYELVHKKRDQVCIATFDEVRTDFGEVMRRFNRQFLCAFAPFEHTPEHETACFKTLERAAEKKYGASRDTTNRAAKPTPERQQVKREIMDELSSPPYRKDLSRADALYHMLTHSTQSPTSYETTIS